MTHDVTTSFSPAEQDALVKFDGGVPVLIDNQQLRGWLLNHRWGRHSYHEPLSNDPCPACRRTKLRQLAGMPEKPRV